MALHYGSLQQRLCRRRDQRWVPFPQETIEAIQGAYALLHTIPTAASSLEVLERAGDPCQATVRQRAQVTRPQTGASGSPSPCARAAVGGCTPATPRGIFCRRSKGPQDDFVRPGPKPPCGAWLSAVRSTAVVRMPTACRKPWRPVHAPDNGGPLHGRAIAHCAVGY